MIRKTRRVSDTPEGKLQRACLNVLTAKGVAHWRVNVRGVPGRRATNLGMSDIVAIATGKARGALWGIELKASGGLNPDQLDFCYAVRKAGGHYSVIQSVEELLEHLHSLEHHGQTPR